MVSTFAHARPVNVPDGPPSGLPPPVTESGGWCDLIFGVLTVPSTIEGRAPSLSRGVCRRPSSRARGWAGEKVVIVTILETAA